MSYILEALKKAQAERQLGHAPTLDAVPVGAAPAAAPARRLPLAAIAIVAAAIGAGALWWWMKPASAPAPVIVAAAPAPAPVNIAPTPAPVTLPPLVVTPPSAPMRVPEKPVVPVVAKPAPAPLAAKRAAPEEERVPTLRELPENVRAAIPQLSFGGYMYSANPADRLILVDKVLRHEGEEVAPGLVLEKLLPKAALMNYRGTRYQVPY